MNIFRRTLHVTIIMAALPLVITIARAQTSTADSVRILTEQANEAFQKNDFARGAELGKKLIALGRRDSGIFYGTGLALLLTGRKEQAVQYLDTAAMLGWDDIENWERNPVLAALKGDDTYERALARVRENAGRKNGQPSVVDEDTTLLRLFDDDQRERIWLLQDMDRDSAHSQERFRALYRNDSLRRTRVRELISSSRLKAGVDYYRAAMIFQHGADTADFLTAHLLALHAIDLGYSDARWLAAAALDRYLVTIGKPQKYGTQSRKNSKTGEMELYPVDPAITDQERAEWNVPSLEVAREQVKNMKKIQ